MALTTTTLVAGLDELGWQSAPDVVRDFTNQPRGELRCLIPTTALTAGGTGNEMLVAGVAELPRNFAYSLLELYFRISKTVAATNNFEASAAVSIIDDNDGSNETVDFQFEMVSVGVCSIGSLFETRLYAPVVLPKLIMIAPGGQGPADLVVRCLNRTQDDDDYAAAMFARFAVYDIAQAFNVGVNIPVLTR